MRPELVEWDEIKLLANFAVKVFKSSAYVGQLDEDLKRSGKGIITYASGRAYEGSWLNDRRHG